MRESVTIKDLMKVFASPTRTIIVCGGAKIAMYHALGSFHVLVLDPDGKWIVLARDMGIDAANQMFDTMVVHYGGDKA